MVACGRTIARQGQLLKRRPSLREIFEALSGKRWISFTATKLQATSLPGLPLGRDDFANYGAVLRLNLNSESSLWHSNARHSTPHPANLNLPLSARHFGALQDICQKDSIDVTVAAPDRGPDD
jgi:hypothetical protein